MPAAETLRAFLNRFHDEAALAARVPHTAFIPADSAGLRGLAAVQEQRVRALQQRAPQPRATLDVDANLIPSAKRTALPMYEDGTGYPPLGVGWAEQEVWVQSQFRDGNVAARCGVLEIAQQSVATLRALGVTEFALRSDSAGYQHAVLNWARAERIPFAIRADLSPDLKARIAALPATASAPTPRGGSWWC